MNNNIKIVRTSTSNFAGIQCVGAYGVNDIRNICFLRRNVSSTVQEEVDKTKNKKNKNKTKSNDPAKC
jgi:hypothetical protein